MLVGGGAKDKVFGEAGPPVSLCPSLVGTASNGLQLERWLCPLVSVVKFSLSDPPVGRANLAELHA